MDKKRLLRNKGWVLFNIVMIIGYIIVPILSPYPIIIFLSGGIVALCLNAIFNVETFYTP